MKFALGIFVVVVTFSFTVSAPSKGKLEPHAQAKETTNTDENKLQLIRAHNFRRVPSSSVFVVVNGVTLQKDNEFDIDNLGTSHKHGLNLRELLLLKAIMDEDVENMPSLPPLPNAPIDKVVQSTNKENDNVQQDTSCQYMVCPTVYQPVCGSNQETYSNYCALLQQSCTHTTLMKLYDGECETEGDDYDDTMSDPVFGKLRDFLDDLSVADLKRAISKLKARKLEILSENDQFVTLTTSKPSVEKLQEQTVRKDDMIGPCQQEFEATKQRVENAIANGNSPLGMNLPYCDEDGFYSFKQCSGSVCYCVDRLGKPTLGQAPLWQADELTCNQQQDVVENVDEAMETLRNILGKNKYPRG